jgi:simple sugar transport system permease protein
MSNGLVELIATTLLTTTPILLAALAGAICLQAGIVHIGLEGVMLAGAFGAVIGSYNWGGSGAGLALAVALALALRTR